MDEKTEKRTLKLDSTLSKGLTILESLATAKKAKGVTQLANELDLTKSNTFRLLQTLRRLGYVNHNANRHYEASLKAWRIGLNVLENLNLPEVAKPAMIQLSAATGETVYLAVPEALSVVYINKIDSAKPKLTQYPIGGTAPMHCVATGKAILAVNYEKLRDSIRNHLVKYTNNTLTDLPDLDANMERTLKQGYSVDRSEHRDHVTGFGAPICLANGEAVAALGISVPEVNLPASSQKTLGMLVCDAAKSVSMRLQNI